MLHLQGMYRKWHVGPPVTCCCWLAPWWADTCLLTHFQPFSWDFQENDALPHPDLTLLSAVLIPWALLICILQLQTHILMQFLLIQAWIERKRLLGKCEVVKISPCVLNASKIWDSCIVCIRMWIDGPILPRRGYVNMIKADYSVHLQIKGAEPISTPTFNTADDQVRTQPGEPRWAHFIRRF